MAEEKEFQERIKGIEALIKRLEEMPDRKIWGSVRTLLQSVMDLHGAALDRMMTILAERGETITPIMEAMGDDELVGSVLLLHGLHPVDLRTRVESGLDKAGNILRGYNARTELLSVTEGNIRIAIHGVSTSMIAKSCRIAIEEAIYRVAPDVASLSILGLENFGSSDFVPLDNLRVMPEAANGHMATQSGKGGVSTL
jgi:hypothetical protein